MISKKTVPIFYATDKRYLPFLAVALQSLKETKTQDYEYRIHVLYTGELGSCADEILKMQEESFCISFHDVSQKLAEIEAYINCRDNYTSAIYYRLFIPDLFPQYDKAVYLDCDTVVLAEIGKLYDIDVKENYIGAVADEVVAGEKAFRNYTKNALGIDANKYFNSGVIVMNTKKFREVDFYQAFRCVLRCYDFIVAPDQDVLNLICKNHVYYYDSAWNVMPVAGKTKRKPKLVHYNLALKPWHYDNVKYEEHFWKYARHTAFFEHIVACKATFTTAQALRDKTGSQALIALAQAEADNPCNYAKTVAKKEQIKLQKRNNGVGMYGFIESFAKEKGELATD